LVLLYHDKRTIIILFGDCRKFIFPPPNPLCEGELKIINMLFKQHNTTLTQFKEKTISLEKTLQTLFEQNLEKIFGLTLVKSECIIKNKKIDTLAFDPFSRAFCVIEYKKDKSFSVFDQGITYLNLLLKNKGEMTSEYLESCGIRLGRGDVRWQHSKIIFVAPAFTDYQEQAAELWSTLPLGREFAIELWEVKQYENGIIMIRPVKKSVPQVRDESSIPSEARLLKGKPEEILKIYSALKKAILSLNRDISIKPKKLEIGFMLKGRIFTDVSLHRDFIKLWINMKRGTLNDPRKLTRDVSKLRHWGSGDYELRLRDTKNLNYILSLIKQSLQHP